MLMEFIIRKTARELLNAVVNINMETVRDVNVVVTITMETARKLNVVVNVNM